MSDRQGEAARIDLTGRQLIEPGDFTVAELESIFDLADQIISSGVKYPDRYDIP